MRSRGVLRIVVVPLLAGALSVGLAQRVSAHGGEDTSDKASDIVRQCIALMVNAPGDMDMQEDKIHDAIEAADKAGVDIDDVVQAHTEFHAGDLVRSQAYLEAAIGVQPRVAGISPASVSSDVMPAIGAEPGAEFLDQPLDGVRNLSGGNLVALVLSIAAVAGGAALALRGRRASPGRA